MGTADDVADPFRVFGGRVHPLTEEQFVEFVVQCARDDGGRTIVANHNLHSLYLVDTSPEMRRYYGLADITYIDGVPISLFGRLRGGTSGLRTRMTAVDYMPRLLDVADEERWRIAIIGSRPDVLRAGRAWFEQEYPSIALYTHHGYFEDGGSEERAILDDLQAEPPHLLLVGLGMPRQEEWVARLYPVPARVTMTVGAWIQYVTGHSPTCPRPLARLGLEGPYRLLREPTRLGSRYLVEPLVLASRVLRHGSLTW